MCLKTNQGQLVNKTNVVLIKEKVKMIGSFMTIGFKVGLKTKMSKMTWVSFKMHINDQV
jgi:hypothetical protein